MMLKFSWIEFVRDFEIFKHKGWWTVGEVFKIFCRDFAPVEVLKDLGVLLGAVRWKCDGEFNQILWLVFLSSHVKEDLLTITNRLCLDKLMDEKRSYAL